MLVELTARSIRVGGQNIAPGSVRALLIPLSARATDEKNAAVAVPAWAAVGQKAGPRVSVVAAVRGFEAAAALAAAELCKNIEPAAMAGSLVVVPVLRPGGQLARAGRPAPAWRFPGDAGGTRRARDAFVLFSEVAVGATVVIVLGAPPAGRRGALCVRGDLDDPRTRRLALETGTQAALSTRGLPGSLPAAAAGAGVTALELRAGGAPGREAADVDDLVAAMRAILVAVGLLAPPVPAAPLILTRPLVLRAPVAGLVEPCVVAGQRARKGMTLARMIPLLGGRPVAVTAPKESLVLESPLRAAEHRRAKLFVIGGLSRADAKRARAGGPAEPGAAAAVAPGGAATPAARNAEANAKLRIGWVEHIALPNLGITRLKAKIDTGARTSALHVARMRVVDTDGGPQRRPILEITVPGGPRGTRPVKVRAAVRGYVVVRDTSGRMEKRPVIETALQIGPFKKRILVTLTNRGDMLFPMLIGRTALGPGIIVDPSRRYLLSIS